MKLMFFTVVSILLDFCRRDLKIENFLLDEHNNIKVVGTCITNLEVFKYKILTQFYSCTYRGQNPLKNKNCDVPCRLWPEQHAEGRIIVSGSSEHPVWKSGLRSPGAAGSQEVWPQSGRLVYVSDIVSLSVSPV